jgi:hypothetical protein
MKEKLIQLLKDWLLGPKVPELPYSRSQALRRLLK